LTRDDDRPRNGGDANGVGNVRPCTPETKCGTKFAEKAPAKKYAAR
jgi:hypothetical protein